MPDYVNPNKTEFDQAEQSLLDTMATAFPALLTKTGSVIRELVVRPMAYLYAWATGNTSSARETSSVEFLQNSQATENPVADLVAWNYFVSRRQGTRSKGVVTLITTSSIIQLTAGSTFSAQGQTLVTETQIIAMDTSYSISGNVTYVPIYPYSTADGTYITNIPVVASSVGAVEIPAGEPVTIGFGNTSIREAFLTSPITGGSNTETDAELMARARYSTAESGIGTYYGLKKKLDNAPVAVLDLGVSAGEDTLMSRARYNTVNINTGGFVDCYVKTQKQYSSALLSAEGVYDSDTQTYSAVFKNDQYAGLYGVTQVLANGETINSYTVSFESASPFMDGGGARLGTSQELVITFPYDTEEDSMLVTINAMYMPGLSALQSFLDADTNKYIGQDVQVKAAVPVTLRMDCVLKYNGTIQDDTLDNIKQAIADKVNSLPVGLQELNFSDIAESVITTYPEADLRLPCVISADMIMKDGSQDSFYSTSGLLNIAHPVSPDYWDAAVCFFSIVPSNIRIDVL